MLKAPQPSEVTCMLSVLICTLFVAITLAHWICLLETQEATDLAHKTPQRTPEGSP